MRATLTRTARAGWPVVVSVLLGLAVGGIWTFAQPDRYRAEALVVVRGTAPSRAVPAVRALAESSLLEQNVAQTLRLSHPPRVTAEAEGGGVLKLSVEAGSRDRARQIDAEVVLVLTQLVGARFGNTQVETTVVDPSHPVEQTSPTPGRNLLIGGLIGLGLGLAASVALARGDPRRFVGGAVDPGVERRLKARIDAVAKRERALAKRAAELAVRERALAEGRTEPEPEPVPEPGRVVAAELIEHERGPAPAAPSFGSVPQNLDELERRVRQRSHEFPDRVEEWNSYLFFLREHADSAGTLPPSFDSLVADVFGELVA
jgi:hypothetical protein